MKFLSTILFLCSSVILGDVKLEDLDYFRILSDSGSKSIISSGTNHCNKFFDKDNLSVDFQGYKDFCKDIILSWPEIADHMDAKFVAQRKQYLGGFYVDYLYNDKFLEFTNNYPQDQSIIHNEINNFILENRKKFSDDNYENNEIIKKEINKITKIYKKIVKQELTDLEKIIKIQLNKIVRYKIFVNDINNFKSYSCNWQPGKGLIPYVKIEKFSEFEKS